MDHNTPTKAEERADITDDLAKMQLETLRQNCIRNNIKLEDMDSDYNGIVHMYLPLRVYGRGN